MHIQYECMTFLFMYVKKRVLEKSTALSRSVISLCFWDRKKKERDFTAVYSSKLQKKNYGVEQKLSNYLLECSDSASEVVYVHYFPKFQNPSWVARRKSVRPIFKRLCIWISMIPQPSMLTEWEGWHIFSPLSIRTTLATHGCLWAYICGRG